MPMFKEIDESLGVRTLLNKGLFIHFTTISDGEVNIEHWRGLDRNGACLRMIDPDEGEMISIEHFTMPGHALQRLQRLMQM